MKIRVHNIAVWFDEPESVISKRIAEKLKVSNTSIRKWQLARSVLDARKKNSPRYIHTVDVEFEDGAVPKLPHDASVIEDEVVEAQKVARLPSKKPIIVGTGPAGLFCAYALLESGIPSILLERGHDVIQRRKDVAQLMRDGTLNPESNMNFGEGGAGAYTDGKLSTRINHPLVRKVIETFARFGAPERIRVQGKPHIGSDLLPFAVERMRHELVAQGCEVYFNTRVDDIVLESDGSVRGVKLSDGRTLDSDRIVLAPGNSSRELFEKFAKDEKIQIEAKPFAIGFRAEHPQTLINAIQYGNKLSDDKRLPPADYKLVENLSINGEMRGVFSFCMCPGGIVVPTPTEEGLQCTNGMSNSRRNAFFANSGVVVTVGPTDFQKAGFHGPLSGLQYQQAYERRAYELGGGKFNAPAQTVPDFMRGAVRSKVGKSSYRPGLLEADLNQIFSSDLNDALKAALRGFENKMHGFLSNEGKLIGIESRTSSPLRITRNEQLQSVSNKGLYPAGEGCGYAGGIVSSGIDGIRIAQQIVQELSS